MTPQDPHQLRRRIMLMVLIVLFPVACTQLNCKPGISADVVKGCSFNVSSPTACVETIWAKLTCPF